MKFKVFLRPSIAVVFGFIGLLVAKNGTPPDIFNITGGYFLVIAALAFGTLGFLLPDILELAGRAGVSALAKQIADRIPTPGRVSRMAFRRKAKGVQAGENLIVVDTSVLIDGRIVEVAKSGFLWGKLVISGGVLGELHNFADSADSSRRAKGRRGLDILRELQKVKRLKVQVLKNKKEGLPVDNEIIELSGKLKARLMTLDFNLNKVGKVRGVEILNINELASALKTPVLPHEQLTGITIAEKGKEKGQGVGYLSDGTMIVVENGAQMVGKKVNVVVRKVIATAAGKMIFAVITRA